MWKTIQEALKQPYRVVALLLGVILLVGPCITIDKDYAWSTHEPATLWLVLVGVALITLSAVAFFLESV
jgi:hypothetical protein